MKPTIMILGSEHLANPGADTFNRKMDDVLAPKRQRELEQLTQQLTEFKPTKVALEIDEERSDADVQEKYQGYLNGTYELTRSEGDQIGFRLAKQMGHSKVYCVDYFPEQDPFHDVLKKIWVDSEAIAKANNQEHLLSSVPEGRITEDEDGTIWIEPEKYEPLINTYIRLNQPEGRLADHQHYLRAARIGQKAQYPEANWMSHFWYDRNLKIFVNLTRITESAEDRILLLIGAGHVYLVQQFLQDSGDYVVESPLQYLTPEQTE